ncbi:MAG: hypothetical protein JSS86_09635 [Cyanobacteria bacterium SZAS LIN-2]|nr:hypothetical protein [Cyanobacteria bacterium SZAS LIN-3]MBS1996561.1 hypothetical protein [Cyanobacteria bacterium SZAS LIN-2]
MNKVQTPPASQPRPKGSWYVARILTISVLITLAFFQPGWGWIVSLITAFVLAFRAASSSRFFWGLSATIAYAGLYVLICVFALPLIHTYTLAAWHWLPVWGSALTAGLLSWAIFFHGRRQEWSTGSKVAANTAVWLLALGIAGGSWLSAQNQDVVEWSMAEALAPERIEQLPNSDMDNFRLLPQARALDYLRISNHDNRLYVSLPHMAPCDSGGKECWEGSFHLKGKDAGIWYNLLGDTVFDVATVDPTNILRNSAPAGGLNGFFLFGPNSWVIKAAFALHNPFSEQEEALYWRDDDGSIVMLIPYVSYTPTVTGVMRPYLAGVLSVNHYGLINDMSAASAAEKYPGVPFYPTRLARTYAEIYAKWNGGIWGRTVSKNHELRVSEPNVTSNPHFNKAPYIEVYEGIGWQEVIALEPAANESKALASLLFFDASTGHCRQYVVPTNVTLNGPVQAMANSMPANWEADWTNNMKVEPRPLIRNGHIYYAVGILDTQGDEHPYVRSIIVDGRDMKPYQVNNHAELLSLIDKLERGIPVPSPKFFPATQNPGAN